MSYLVVLVTAPSEDLAARIAGVLVQERLAACVNIIRSVRSIYRWEGQVEDDSEVLMIIKTRSALFDSLKEKVKELHEYTVPEIISAHITGGLDDYLDWIGQSTIEGPSG